MNFVCVDARFYIWDGKTEYTVEYGYESGDWYIFKEHEKTNALFHKRGNLKKKVNVDRYSAEEVLYDYLNGEK